MHDFKFDFYEDNKKLDILDISNKNISQSFKLTNDLQRNLTFPKNPCFLSGSVMPED